MKTNRRIVRWRAPMIQLCPTCGRMRVHHRPRGLYDCPTPREVTEAIRAFARANGKTWKSRLCKLWASDSDISPELKQAKEMIGRRRIYKIKP